MPENSKTTSWKSFVFALAGAYLVFCSICLGSNPKFETSEAVVFGIWGVCYWAGGTGNLFVDRRLEREAKKLGVG